MATKRFTSEVKDLLSCSGITQAKFFSEVIAPALGDDPKIRKTWKGRWKSAFEKRGIEPPVMAQLLALINSQETVQTENGGLLRLVAKEHTELVPAKDKPTRGQRRGGLVSPQNQSTQQEDTGLQPLRNAILPDSASFPSMTNGGGEPPDTKLRTISSILEPVSYVPRIALLASKGIVERKWLLEAVRLWHNTPNRQGSALFITGKPGVGKSVIAAQLVNAIELPTLAAAFCEFRKPSHSNPVAVIRSLAYQVAVGNAEYRMHLSSVLENYSLHGRSATELLDELLVQPLKEIESEAPELIVIDAVDEATSDSNNDLYALLTSRADRLPEWVSLVLIGREDSSAVMTTQECHRLEVSASASENLNDIKQFVHVKLADILASLPDADAAIDQILLTSAGNFLHAEMICRDIIQKRYSLEENLALLPKGLAGFYAAEFSRMFSSPDDFRELLQPLLSLMASRRAPLPLTLAADCLGVSLYALRQTLIRTSHIFHISQSDEGPHEEVLSLFHKSLDDWITRHDENISIPIAGQYAADIESGNRMIAKAGVERWRSGKCTESYLFMHLVDHLLTENDTDEACSLLTDLEWLETAISYLGPYSLPSQFRRLISKLEEADGDTFLVEIVDRAIRGDLEFIAAHVAEYPQATMQSVVNYVSSLHSITTTGDASVLFSAKQRADLAVLRESWVQYNTDRQRPWLSIESAPPHSMNDQMQWSKRFDTTRFPTRIAWAPDGMHLAVSTSHPRAHDQSIHWTESILILLLSSQTGETISTPVLQDCGESDGPPEFLQVPRDLAKLREEYFKHKRTPSRQGISPHLSGVANDWWTSLHNGVLKAELL